ncbi:unnamed protein product [Choristocarpus tenellus]
MDLVGYRVEVYWSAEVEGEPGDWYEGVLDSYDKTRGGYLILYDDGDEEWVGEVDGQNVRLLDHAEAIIPPGEIPRAETLDFSAKMQWGKKEESSGSEGVDVPMGASKDTLEATRDEREPKQEVHDENNIFGIEPNGAKGRGWARGEEAWTERDGKGISNHPDGQIGGGMICGEEYQTCPGAENRDLGSEGGQERRDDDGRRGLSWELTLTLNFVVNGLFRLVIV